MTTAAIAAYMIARWEMAESLTLVEALVIAAAFATPLAILALREAAGPWSWAPMAAMFALMARREAWPEARETSLGARLAPEGQMR